MDNIIIKRQQRRGRDNAKVGGAWKVAFADFTLAMMAFFMMLWILAVSNDDERHGFSETLRTYSVFDGSNNPFDIANSANPVDFGTDFNSRDARTQVKADQLRPSNKTAPSLNKKTAADKGDSGYGELPKMNSTLSGKLDSPEQLALLADKLNKIANQQGAADNIAVEVVPQGLRIVLHDNDEQMMFKRGSAMMTYFFQDVLRSLAPVFRQFDNKLMISGHTDATGYHNAAFTNWELSSQRALQARQMLHIGGMPKDRVAQIAAMSDTRLMDENNPKSSQNRRIELLLLTEAAEQALELLFGQESGAIGQAKQAASDNQPILRSEALLAK